MKERMRPNGAISQLKWYLKWWPLIFHSKSSGFEKPWSLLASIFCCFQLISIVVWWTKLSFSTSVQAPFEFLYIIRYYFLNFDWWALLICLLCSGGNGHYFIGPKLVPMTFRLVLRSIFAIGLIHMISFHRNAYTL